MSDLVAKLFRLAQRIVFRMIGMIRGYIVNLKVSERSNGGGIHIIQSYIPIKITIGKDAKFILRGKLKLGLPGNFGGAPISIRLGQGSILEINGDFTLGPGCRLVISEGAKLYIGGKDKESDSGITGDTLVMVRKTLNIGPDLICAWGCFITDCDWHQIDGQPFQLDTSIGRHVWIAPNCSILKGSRIGDGSIISIGSVVHKIDIPQNTLCGGSPLRVLSEGKSWHRDLPARDLG